MLAPNPPVSGFYSITVNNNPLYNGLLTYANIIFVNGSPSITLYGIVNAGTEDFICNDGSISEIDAATFSSDIVEMFKESYIQLYPDMTSPIYGGLIDYSGQKASYGLYFE